MPKVSHLFRSHPAIVLKQRTRTVPSVRLVNRVLQIAPRRRTLRKNSSQRRTERRDRPQELLIPSQAIASNEMSARLQRLGERPRLVAVIRMPTLTTTSLMRILLVHFQRNQYNIMFPDQDYLRSQIEHLIGSNRGSGNSGSDTRH